MPTFTVQARPHNRFVDTIYPENILYKEYSYSTTGGGAVRRAPLVVGENLSDSSFWSTDGFTGDTVNELQSHPSTSTTVAIADDFLTLISLSDELLEPTNGIHTIEGTISIPGPEIWPILHRIRVFARPYAPDLPGLSRDRFREVAFTPSVPAYRCYVEREGRDYRFYGSGIGLVAPQYTGVVDRIEFEVMGEVYEATLYLDRRFGTEFFSAGSPLQSTAFEFTHTFTADSGQPVRMRLWDVLGYNTGWQEVVMPPVADFVVTSDDEYGTETVGAQTRFFVSGTEMYADPAPSFSPTSTLTDWYWRLTPPFEDPGALTHNTTGARMAWGIEEMDSEHPTNGSTDLARVELFVYDGEWPAPLNDTDYNEHADISNMIGAGVFAWYDENYHDELVFVRPGSNISAVSDTSGIMTVAITEGGGVRVNRFIGSTATKEPLALIPSAGGGSLTRTGSTLNLVARSGGNWSIWRSNDYGETFQQGDTIMNATEYTGVRSCGLHGGGILLAGLAAGTREVWTSVALDGVNFSDPAPALDGDSTTWAIPDDERKTIDVFHEAAGEASRIRITNGGEFTILNHDFAEAGSEWTEL